MSTESKPESKTPRTDAIFTLLRYSFQALISEQAKLETELAAVTKERDRARSEYAILAESYGALRTQRDQLRQRVEELETGAVAFRDSVLNGRFHLEGVLDNDQTNAVLSNFDDAFSTLCVGCHSNPTHSFFKTVTNPEPEFNKTFLNSTVVSNERTLPPHPGSPESETDQTPWDAAAGIRETECEFCEIDGLGNHAPRCPVELERNIANLQTSLDNARAQERVMHETAEGHAKTLRDIAESVLGDADLANRGDVAKLIKWEIGKFKLIANESHQHAEVEAHAHDEARETIKKLRAELDKAKTALIGSGWTLKEGAEAWKPPVNVAMGEMRQRLIATEHERDTSLADVARLREALEPFAKLASRWSPRGSFRPNHGDMVSLTHLWDAADALSAPASDRLRELEFWSNIGKQCAAASCCKIDAARKESKQ